jgi:hypothetical protein
MWQVSNTNVSKTKKKDVASHAYIAPKAQFPTPSTSSTLLLPNQVLFILANNAGPNLLHLLQMELLADGTHA